jgi:hypothetical protein
VDTERSVRLAILWRGTPDARATATAGNNRLSRVFDALADHRSREPR